MRQFQIWTLEAVGALQTTESGAQSGCTPKRRRAGRTGGTWLPGRRRRSGPLAVGGDARRALPRKRGSASDAELRVGPREGESNNGSAHLGVGSKVSHPVRGDKAAKRAATSRAIGSTENREVLPASVSTGRQLNESREARCGGRRGRIAASLGCLRRVSSWGAWRAGSR